MRRLSVTHVPLVDHFPFLPTGHAIRLGGAHSLRDLEVAHITAVLKRHGPAQAAVVLGIERSTLSAKRRKYGIAAPLKWSRA